MLWRDYFPLGAVTGVDIKLPPGFAPPDRVQLFQGSQGDKRFLSRVANTVASEGFDIIIDDASHYGHLSRTAFWHLFDWHLKPGGLYVIEDWGTGYWGDWPDGRRYSARKAATAHFWSHWLGRLHIKRPVYAHSYGMVGFIKELVDEQCAADLTRGSLQGVATRVSKFKQLLVTPSIVFVWKAA